MAPKKLYRDTLSLLGCGILLLCLQGCEVDPGGSESNEHATCGSVPTLSTWDRGNYLDAINLARAEPQDCGVYGFMDAVPPLEWSDALYRSAYEHSCDLAKNNFFSHTGSKTRYDKTSYEQNLPRGSSPLDRMVYNGYQGRNMRENIIAGANIDSSIEAVAELLKSDAHCVTIMNPDLNDFGMALVEEGDSKYIYHWTQNFGTN